MRELGVRPIPIELWRYGTKYCSGAHRTVTSDEIYRILLPRDTAQVTEYGIKYKGIYYTCMQAEEDKWFEHARIKGNYYVTISYDPTSVQHIYIHPDDGPLITCNVLDKNRAYEKFTPEQIEQFREDDLNEKAAHAQEEEWAKGEVKRMAAELIKRCKDEKAGAAKIKEALTRHSINDTMDALVMALNTGKIDLIDDLPQVTAQYLCAQNDQMVPMWLYDRERIEAEGGFAMDCFKTGGAGYSFLLMEENQALCDAFNSAIADMKADGTLDQLIRTHIHAAIAGERIEPIALDFVEGRETVRVAVTGSLPPLDYVAEDGTFAGFNTALLAEIGRRIDRNMEIIQVDSIGRAAALSSGTADAVFWASSNPYGSSERLQDMTEEEFKTRLTESHPDYTEEQIEILARMGMASDFQEDIPEHTIVTEPYFVDGLVCVGLKSKIPRE